MDYSKWNQAGLNDRPRPFPPLRNKEGVLISIPLAIRTPPAHRQTSTATDRPSAPNPLSPRIPLDLIPVRVSVGLLV